MQELSAKEVRANEEPESGEEDSADNGAEGEMKQLERDGAQSRSVEGMTEVISRTLRHKPTELLQPAALAERSKKSRPSYKPHVVQQLAQ